MRSKADLISLKRSISRTLTCWRVGARAARWRWPPLLNNFGFIQLRAGQYSDASSHFSRALDLWLRLTKPNDLQVAMSRLGLAEAHIAVGRYRQAGDLLSEILPVFEHNCGPNSLRTEDIVTRYAQVLRHQKRDN